MLRTQISLTEQERSVLDAEADRTGRSVAALIRDAVDLVYGEGRSTLEDLAGLRLSAGAWAGRHREDGVHGGRDHEGGDDEDGAAQVERLRSGRRLS